MNDDPLRAIIDLLEKQFGLARSELQLSSRLLHDLAIDGDDAAQLFGSLHDRYGTDFTALGEQWRIFFNNEGCLRGCFIGAAAIILSTIIWTPVAIFLGLSEQAGGLGAVPLGIGLLGLLHKLCPKRELHPITITGLAEIVRRGAWPGDAADVA